MFANNYILGQELSLDERKRKTQQPPHFRDGSAAWILTALQKSTEMLLGTDGAFKIRDLLGGGQVIEGGLSMELVGRWSPLFFLSLFFASQQ